MKTSKKILSKVVEEFDYRNLLKENVNELFGQKSYEEIAEEIDKIIGKSEREKRGIKNWIDHIEIHLGNNEDEAKRGLNSLKNLLGVK